MKKRVAVITGGARGIGRAIALHLAGSGWSVAICYRTSEREAEETVEAIKKAGVETWKDPFPRTSVLGEAGQDG